MDVCIFLVCAERSGESSIRQLSDAAHIKAICISYFPSDVVCIVFVFIKVYLFLSRCINQ